MAVYTNLFTTPRPVAHTNWATTAGTSGTASNTLLGTAGGPAGAEARRATWTADATAGTGGQSFGTGVSIPASPSTAYSVGAWVRVSKQQTMAPRIQWVNSGGTVSGTVTGSDVVVAANTWTLLKMENQVSTSDTAAIRGLMFSSTAGVLWLIGDTLDVQAGTVVQGATLPQPFHGDMTDDATHDYAWTGTADASTSTLTIPDPPGLAMPTGLSATPISANQIDVNYTRAVTSTGGEDIERNGSIIVTGYTGSLPYHDTGLTASTLYSYYVRSTN